VLLFCIILFKLLIRHLLLGQFILLIAVHLGEIFIFLFKLLNLLHTLSWDLDCFLQLSCFNILISLIKEGLAPDSTLSSDHTFSFILNRLKLLYCCLVHVKFILYLPVFLLKGLVLPFKIVKLLLQLFILIVSDQHLLLCSLPFDLNSFQVLLGFDKFLENQIPLLYHEIYKNESY
jgi:hypothetical protein